MKTNSVRTSVLCAVALAFIQSSSIGQIVEVAPVIRLTATPDASARFPGASPPSSEVIVGPGSTFYIEIWATNSGAPLDGLACVHVDTSYDRTDLIDSVPPEQDGPLFTVSTVPVIFDDPGGLIDDEGGCQSIPVINGLGVGEWVLVERVEMLAISTGGPITVSVADAGNIFAGIAIIGKMNNVDPANVSFLSSVFSVGGCTNDSECDDGNPCTDDTCVSLSCVNTPNDSNDPDDGFFCNGTDTCVGGIPIPGTPPSCDDGNPCTTDLCDEINDVCVNLNNVLPCDDGDNCTENDTCAGGVCSGSPIVPCEPCTLPSECDDGNACTVDDCVQSACEHVDATPPGMCCDPITGVTTPIDDNNVCTTDVCNPDGTVTHTDTTPPGQCCNPLTGDLTPIDDGNPCTDDVCLASGTVQHSNNTDPCDDGDICTENDTCFFGNCVGVILDPLGTPTVDIVLELPLPLGGGPVCIADGDFITIRIDRGPSTPSITGGQFFMEYDPQRLQVIDIVPGDPPYVLQVFEAVDPVNGLIDYAVGVPKLHPGTPDPATMVVLTFQVIAECDTFLRFRDHDPPTLLTDNNGIPRYPDLSNLPPLSINLSAPVLDCPGNITVNADAGSVTAFVTWAPVTATDSCDGDTVVTCVSTPFGGLAQGGTFPPGVTTIDCDSTNSCGVTGTCTFNVEVLPFNEMYINIELSPTIVSGPLIRCITFEFHRCGVVLDSVSQEIEFGGPFTFPGMAENVQVLAPPGPWECVTARDELHTLRSTAPDFSDDGITFSASWLGSRALGGHWLVSGNLNDDDFIDILDYSIYNANFGISFADTDCTVLPFHADINGDGIVTAADFTFIQVNFLAPSEPNCCGLPGANAPDSPGPRMEISVQELHQRQLGHLAVADVNHDGMVDIQDMILFAEQIDVPVKPRLYELLRQSASEAGISTAPAGK